jgi:hypothetical protein
VIAIGQAHGAKQEADGDLAGKVVDELERLLLGDAIDRPVGDFENWPDQPVEIALEKRGLAQCAQRS